MPDGLELWSNYDVAQYLDLSRERVRQIVSRERRDGWNRLPQPIGFVRDSSGYEIAVWVAVLCRMHLENDSARLRQKIVSNG